MDSVGEILKQSRVHKQWTPEAASRATKIRVHQLLALEQNDYSKFAAPAYARGFVRIYARSLGLDEKSILSQLDGTFEGDDDDMFVHAPAVDYVPERMNASREAEAKDLVWNFMIGTSIAILLATVFFVGSYWNTIVSSVFGDKVQHSSNNLTSPSSPQSTTTYTAPNTSVSDLSPASPSASTPFSQPAITSPMPTTPPGDALVAPRAGIVMHTLKITSLSPRVRVTVKTFSNREPVTESASLNTNDSRQFEGSNFEVDASAPNLVLYGLDGDQPTILSKETTRTTISIPRISGQ